MKATTCLFVFQNRIKEPLRLEKTTNIIKPQHKQVGGGKGPEATVLLAKHGYAMQALHKDSSAYCCIHQWPCQ